MTNPSAAHPVYIQDPNLVITLLVDAPAHVDDRLLADIIIKLKYHLSCFSGYK